MDSSRVIAREQIYTREFGHELELANGQNQMMKDTFP